MFIIHDLGTAAYLMLKGCKLVNIYINEKKVYVFEFDGDEEKLKKIAIEYLNSDCSKFDSQVKNLRKMLR